VATVLLAGCGGGGSKSSKSSSTSPAATTPASTTTTTSQAQADKDKAQRIVLAAADVPGFTVDVANASTKNADLEAAANACVNNNPLLVRLGEATDPRGASSPDFTMGETLTVGSAATFGETEDEARSAIAALSAPAFTGCFSDALAVELRKNPSLTNVTVTTSRLPTVAAGDQSIGYRSTARLRVSGTAVTFYFDFTFVRTGRAVAVLSDVTVGNAYPEADRTRLAAAVAGRMAGP
jgi:hypothetical protein